MKKRSNNSKVSASLTAGLVFFVAIIAFVVGVLSGQSFSDRNHAVNTIEEKGALNPNQDAGINPGMGDDLTDKEVEALTEKALEEARSSSSRPSQKEVDEFIADLEKMDAEQAQDGAAQTGGFQPKSVNSSRGIASVAPKFPTTTAAKNVEFTIQVAAYKTMDEAKGHAERLKIKGLPSFPLEASVKGETWYKVNIGSFASLKAAKRYDRRLKKEGAISASFIRKVKRK